jgi:hypothetical protein
MYFDPLLNGCLHRRFSSVVLARVACAGAVLGMGMCVGFLAVIGFVTGAICGCVIQAVLWALSSRTSLSIGIAVTACIVLLCLCPGLWYCYCSKASRRASHSASGGFLTADYEWYVDTHSITEASE